MQNIKTAQANASRVGGSSQAVPAMKYTTRYLWIRGVGKINCQTK